MADTRMSFVSSASNLRSYANDEEFDEEEYSYYDDEEYYEDEYDDDDGYSRRSDQYSSAVMRRNSNSRYSRNNYGRGGGGLGQIVEYDEDDYDDDYDDDEYYDDYSRVDNRRERGRGGRNDRSNSRNSNQRGSKSVIASILPGTPNQAQDIIRLYTLGMPLQHPNHMALPPSTPPEGPAREIATLQVANLQPQEYAFVRRSNGQWTFAQVAVRHDQLEQLVFIVNRGGSTKSFKRFEWPGFIRRIKWTDRRVELPKPKPALTNNNEMPPPPPAAVTPGPQQGSTQPQLVLEPQEEKNNKPLPPPPPPQKANKPQLPEVSTMSIKEMKLELEKHGIDYSTFMEKQEFRNAVIDARAEAVKNALIREQQQQRDQLRQQRQQQQQQNQQQHYYGDFHNDNPMNVTSNLDADLSNLAGQTITLQPMQEDEVSELMGDYLLTEYKFQMKLLEKERLKKQGGAKNKMPTINGQGGIGGDGQQSSAYQSFNIEGEGERKLPHYEKQAFAKSQKWGASVGGDV